MPVQSEDIDYNSGSMQFQGYLAYDDAIKEKRPGVLVVHEWWGLNDYPKRRARMLAELGYVAFALDMYGKGVITENHEQAGKLMNALLTNPDARSRAQAGLDVLRNDRRVDGNKLAAIGYCMGGALAMDMARAGMPLKAVVSFHGTLNPQSGTKPGSIAAKILVCTGADDPMMPPDKLNALEDELRRAGADWTVITYGGTRHAFTNPAADSRGLPPLKYSAAADRRSWAAMKDFLAEAFG